MNVVKIGDIVSGTCICAEHPYPDTGICISGDPTILSVGSPTGQIGTSIILFSCGTSVLSGVSAILSTGQIQALTGAVSSGCGTGTIIGTSPILSV